MTGWAAFVRVVECVFISGTGLTAMWILRGVAKRLLDMKSISVFMRVEGMSRDQAIRELLELKQRLGHE